jgi:hypothetical protein
MQRWKKVGCWLLECHLQECRSCVEPLGPPPILKFTCYECTCTETYIEMHLCGTILFPSGIMPDSQLRSVCSVSSRVREPV